MTKLTKYQELKMYLSVNGYDSLKDLAEDWGVTVNAIRDNCRGKMTSEKIERLTTEFIEAGDKKFRGTNNE